MPNVKRTIPNQFRAALRAGNHRLARVEVIASQMSETIRPRDVILHSYPRRLRDRH